MRKSMLSDKFVQEDLSSNENLSKQIIRLEELSISMTSLIESGNSHKIAHLEKIRQKILKDIIKNKKTISTIDKPRVSNIFFLNDKMIDLVRQQKTETLGRIKKKIKFYKSYKDM